MCLRLKQFSEFLRVKLRHKSGLFDHSDEFKSDTYLWKGCIRISVLRWTIPTRVNFRVTQVIVRWGGGLEMEGEGVEMEDEAEMEDEGGIGEEEEMRDEEERVKEDEE